MLRAVLLALATSASAWEDCLFPRAAWFALDESVGISYAYAIAAMNGNMYSGGYTKGNFAFVGVNNTHDINPEPCATIWGTSTSDTKNLYIAEVNTAGKMEKTWHFVGDYIQKGELGHGPQDNNINAATGLHKMLDNKHIAVAAGFKQKLKLPDGTTLSSECARGDNDRCDGNWGLSVTARDNNRPFVIKLDVSQSAGIGAGTTGWVRQIDSEHAGGGSVDSVDGDAAGHMITSFQVRGNATHDGAAKNYLAKLAANDGSTVWEKEMPYSLRSCRTDSLGDVVCGYSISADDDKPMADFGDGVTLNSTKFDDWLGIVKVSSDGVTQFAKAPFKASFGDLSVSKSGNLLAVVGSRKVARIDLSSGNEGNVLWMDSESGLGSHGFRGVEVTDDETDVVVFGQVSGGDLVLTNDATGATTTLRTRGSYDVYMAVFDAADGRGKYATDGGGNGMEYFFAFAKDSETNAVYIGGTSRSQKMHWGNITRDNVMQPSGVSSRTPVGSSKAFVVKMESTLEKPYCVSTCETDRAMVAADVAPGHCYIDRHCYADGEYPVYPTAACNMCEASVNPLEWSQPDTTNHCFIQGRCYAPGDGKSIGPWWSADESACEVCDPKKATDKFTLKDGYELTLEPYKCRESTWQETAIKLGWRVPCPKAERRARQMRRLQDLSKLARDQDKMHRRELTAVEIEEFEALALEQDKLPSSANFDHLSDDEIDNLSNDD
jgi:hypothetical protein